MAFTIKLDFKGLPKSIKGDAPKKIIDRAIIIGINRILPDLRKRMIKVSPRGGQGLLRNSWQISPAKKDVGGRIIGKVSSIGERGIAALVIDKGARPHFPPPGPDLQRWVRRKLGISAGREAKRVAFAVAQSISKRGLPARRIFTRTFRGLRSGITRELQKTVIQITKRLSG